MNETGLNKNLKTITSFVRDKNNLLNKIKPSSFIGKPTPLDFDAFIPWICLELQVPYKVTVSRTIQELYTSLHRQNSFVKLNKTEQKLDEVTKKSSAMKVGNTSKPNNDDSIPVTACYNSKGHLTEVAIVGSPFEIPRKLIIAITLCLPFHSSIEKISIRKGQVNSAAIQEISKILPHSNITHVFLDNCYVPVGKYHLLLQHTSQLKSLALRRLDIDDIIQCKDILQKLDIGQPASKCLLTLDLSFNKLTDTAARTIGDILRRNRCLLHLNLCGNKICDAGAISMLESLTEFSLTDKEIVDKKRRRFEFLIKRIAFYKQCKDDLLSRQNNEDKENKQDVNKRELKKRITDVSKPPSKENVKRNKKRVSSPSTPKLTINQLAEKITTDNVGKYIDVFDDDNLIIIEKRLYSIGNLRLCSLNLSYNNLSYISVHKIYEVLEYQRNVLSGSRYLSTGLTRILFEGNNVPRCCPEYKGIYILLERAISENAAMSNLTQSAPSLKSSKRTSAPSVKSVGRSSAHVKNYI